MAFRLPNAKKFKPKAKGPIARTASIPSSLAKQSSAPSTQQSSTQPSQSPAPESTPRSTQDDGLPPSIGAPDTDVPAVGSSQSQTQPQPSATPTPTPTFREPSLPPASRPRATSPTLSNASLRSSRTGGRPTLIHLAASTGPAKRPDASPSPAPVTKDKDAQGASSSAPATLSAPRPSRVSQSPRPTDSAPSASTSTSRPTATAPRTSVTPRTSQKDLPASKPPPATQRQRSSVPPPSATPAPFEPSGLPPMIGSSMIDPALLDQTPGAGPSRQRAAEIARDLIADISAQPGPPVKPKPRLNKSGFLKRKPGPPKGQTIPAPNGGTDSNKARAKRKERARAAAAASASAEVDGLTPDVDAANGNSNGTGDGDSEAPGEEATTAEPPKKKRKPRRKLTPQYDSDGDRIRQPRNTYRSRGKWGTEKDGRLRQNREAKLAAEEEVDEFAEDIPIDPSQQKMGSFTRGYHDGDMTERAVKLKEAIRAKREDAQREKVEFERMKRIRLQPLRRRERAKRNNDRAKRRVEWEAAGSQLGPTEVSDDEVDSTEDEYEFEPDRLTPPGTPEPEDFLEQYREDGEEVRDGDDEEQEEGLGDVAAPEEDDEEAEEGDYDHEPAENVDLNDCGFNVGDEQEDGAEAEVRDPNEEDPDTAALFDINPDDMDPDADMDDDGQPSYSYADYAANMEARRAQALATQNTRFVVTEDDDELRMVNTTTWQKRAKTDKWTDDETAFFYSVLGEVGENYGLMKAFFPGRTIAQIKKKGLRENAKNPEKVTAAINARRPIDDQYLRKSAGYDPDRPWDKEEALLAEAKRDMERLRAEDRGEAPPGEGDEDHDPFADETMQLDEQPAEGGEAAEGEEPQEYDVPGLDTDALFLPHDEDIPETPGP